MERFLETPCDPSQLSPLTLAFVGDCVFELFVREALVCRGNCPVKKLHGAAVERVCCSAQAAGMERLMPILTEKKKRFSFGGAMPMWAMFPKMPQLLNTMLQPVWRPFSAILYLQGELSACGNLQAYWKFSTVSRRPQEIAS